MTGQTPQIDTVVFDLGGVLIDWNPAYVYRQLFECEEQMHWFFENVCTHEWNLRQDAGYPLRKATEERIALYPDYESEIRAFYGRWPEMLGGPIDETIRVLRQLVTQGSHRLLALTNWSAETFPVALERYDFLHWFEGIVVSGLEKLIKPDPAFYQVLFDRYTVEPQRAVFIDDNEANVRAAKALGMSGIHFRNAGQLAAELANMGLLSIA